MPFARNIVKIILIFLISILLAGCNSGILFDNSNIKGTIYTDTYYTNLSSNTDTVSNASESRNTTSTYIAERNEELNTSSAYNTEQDNELNTSYVYNSEQDNELNTSNTTNSVHITNNASQNTSITDFAYSSNISSAKDVLNSNTSDTSDKSSSSKIRVSSQNDNSLSSSVSSEDNKDIPSSSSTITSSTQSSASSVSSEASSKQELKLKTIKVKTANKGYFKTVGRCETGTASGLALGYGGSEIEFDMLCEGELVLSFSFEAGNKNVWLKITVDGKATLSERYEISASCDVKVADSLEYGLHRIKIVRLTDCEAKPVVLSSITAYGELIEQAPPNKSLYIEAIGTSAFMGYGVSLKESYFASNFNEGEARKAEYQDATLTYPYLAASKLNADCYLFARAGAGFAATNLITTQTVGGTAMEVGDPMGLLPKIYPLVSIHSDITYSAERKPDVIVVDAGAADTQYEALKRSFINGKLGINIEYAKKVAKEFLENIKISNPKVKIIWCYGLVSGPAAQTEFINDVTAALGGEQQGVYTLALPNGSQNGYPSYSEHKAAAEVLYQKIKAVL